MLPYLNLSDLVASSSDWASSQQAVRLPVAAPFGLSQIGINHTRLPPGAISALRHYHSHQDEWLLVLAGAPTLITDEGEWQLAPGSCVGFAHGAANAHQLVNRSSDEVLLLEVSDRTPGDRASYPHDDPAVVKAALGG